MPRRIHHWTSVSRKPGLDAMLGTRLMRGMEGHRAPDPWRLLLPQRHEGCSSSTELHPVVVARSLPHPALLLHLQAPPSSEALPGPPVCAVQAPPGPSRRCHVLPVQGPPRTPRPGGGGGCWASEGRDGDHGLWKRPGNSLPERDRPGGPFTSDFPGFSF